MDILNLIKNKKFDELLEYIKKNIDIIDLDVYDESYNYFIQYVIIYNAIDILKYILNNGNVRLDILDIDGRNLLYIPIKYNYIDILKLLIEFDKKNIGMSLLDVRDNNGYNGLHYCIIFNNIAALNLLYNITNTFDNNGNNIYSVCLQYKRPDILIHILDTELKKTNSVYNFINIKGESVLQSAINNDEMKVVSYIVNNKAFLHKIINNKENEYGLTALHQCIVLGHNDIVIKLIENGANINMSDFLGNTPLHYLVIEKNYIILNYLINSNSNKELYYSETNLTGNTPLHLLMEEDIINISLADNKDSIDLYKCLLKMIEKTDINIMNNNGYTILHYIAMKNLHTLIDIRNILTNGLTHMNLFIKNKDGLTVLDIITSTTNRDIMINIAIDSFYIILINNIKGDLSIPWEKKCGEGESVMDKKYCLSKIRKQILENSTSMPTYTMMHSFIIDNINDDDNIIKGCYYTGSTLDILFGLVYLYTNNMNDISLLLEYPLTDNKELEKYYMRMGINYNHNLEFNNIEIVWIFMKLIFLTNFDSILHDRMKLDERFIVIPLGIIVSTGSHANILIIDKTLKRIERFEPNGKNNPRGFYYNPDLLDLLLTKKFSELEYMNDYAYFKPIEYLPTIGFQILETSQEEKCKKIGDPNGFCAVWCIWWVEQKIKNPDVESKILVEELIKQIKFSNKSFKKLIRNYSMKIVLLRDEYLNKYNISIDDIINNNYDIDVINNIEKSVLEKIN
jgi:ankyrin repeat protein